jgi:hypothetical protein
MKIRKLSQLEISTVIGTISENVRFHLRQKESLHDLAQTFQYQQLIKESTRITETSSTLIDNSVLWLPKVLYLSPYSPARIYFTRGEARGEENPLVARDTNLSSMLTLPFENLQNRYYIL